jgi:hypothetical protein
LEARSAANAGQEGLRRPTVVQTPVAADPEVSERPRRRTFTAREKLRIIKEADQAAGIGALGAILRRHGLYSSALSEGGDSVMPGSWAHSLRPRAESDHSGSYPAAVKKLAHWRAAN